MKPIYLDANASEPLRPKAADALLKAAQWVGNPSSIHQQGRFVRAALEQARDKIATSLGSYPINCIFTSGGTEANALAMHGLGKEHHFLVGTTEHDAVRKNIPNTLPRTWLDVDSNGRVKLDILEKSLATYGSSSFVCLMAANNETGVIHPLKEIARLTHKYGGHFHCDGVQAVGRMALSMEDIGIDSLACSGHKVGGAKGAGALLIRDEIAHKVEPLYDGGGQEMGRRSGTPPLPTIISFSEALEETQNKPTDFSIWRDYIEQRASEAGAVIAGKKAPRLNNTSSLILPGLSAQSQLMQLDLKNISISSGPACSSGTMQPSHVLKAMGFGDNSQCAIRVSLPWNCQSDEIRYFAETYCDMAKRYFSSKT